MYHLRCKTLCLNATRKGLVSLSSIFIEWSNFLAIIEMTVGILLNEKEIGPL